LAGNTPLKTLPLFNQICQMESLLKGSLWMFSPLLSDAMEVKILVTIFLSAKLSHQGQF